MAHMELASGSLAQYQGLVVMGVCEGRGSGEAEWWDRSLR